MFVYFPQATEEASMRVFNFKILSGASQNDCDLKQILEGYIHSETLDQHGNVILLMLLRISQDSGPHEEGQYLLSQNSLYGQTSTYFCSGAVFHDLFRLF